MLCFFLFDKIFGFKFAAAFLPLVQSLSGFSNPASGGSESETHRELSVHMLRIHQKVTFCFFCL